MTFAEAIPLLLRGKELKSNYVSWSIKLVGGVLSFAVGYDNYVVSTEDLEATDWEEVMESTPGTSKCCSAMTATSTASLRVTKGLC